MDEQQLNKITNDPGFIAALDQSGGSTPKALKLYGIDESEYSGEDEMFDLIHQARERIITSPVFTSDRVLGAILFEATMDREIQGTPDVDDRRRGHALAEQDAPHLVHQDVVGIELEGPAA